MKRNLEHHHPDDAPHVEPIAPLLVKLKNKSKTYIFALYKIILRARTKDDKGLYMLLYYAYYTWHCNTQSFPAGDERSPIGFQCDDTRVGCCNQFSDEPRIPANHESPLITNPQTTNLDTYCDSWCIWSFRVLRYEEPFTRAHRNPFLTETI